MKGVTPDLANIDCPTCKRSFQPVKRYQRFCGEKCRPSRRAVAVRMSPEELAALARLYRRAQAAES